MLHPFFPTIFLCRVASVFQDALGSMVTDVTFIILQFSVPVKSIPARAQRISDFLHQEPAGSCLTNFSSKKTANKTTLPVFPPSVRFLISCSSRLLRPQSTCPTRVKGTVAGKTPRTVPLLFIFSLPVLMAQQQTMSPVGPLVKKHPPSSVISVKAASHPPAQAKAGKNRYCRFICRKNRRTATTDAPAAYPRTHIKWGNIPEKSPRRTARSNSTAWTNGRASAIF